MNVLSSFTVNDIYPPKDIIYLEPNDSIRKALSVMIFNFIIFNY